MKREFWMLILPLIVICVVMVSVILVGSIETNCPRTVNTKDNIKNTGRVNIFQR